MRLFKSSLRSKFTSSKGLATFLNSTTLRMLHRLKENCLTLMKATFILKLVEL